jgi:hypothetical protein
MSERRKKTPPLPALKRTSVGRPVKHWLSRLHARRKDVLLRAPVPGVLLIVLIFLLRASVRMPLIVTPVPCSQRERGVSQLIAVSGKADPRRQQIALRTMTSSSLSQMTVCALPVAQMIASQQEGDPALFCLGKQEERPCCSVASRVRPQERTRA